MKRSSVCYWRIFEKLLIMNQGTSTSFSVLTRSVFFFNLKILTASHFQNLQDCAVSVKGCLFVAHQIEKLLLFCICGDTQVAEVQRTSVVGLNPELGASRSNVRARPEHWLAHVVPHPSAFGASIAVNVTAQNSQQCIICEMFHGICWQVQFDCARNIWLFSFGDEIIAIGSAETGASFGCTTGYHAYLDIQSVIYIGSQKVESR